MGPYGPWSKLPIGGGITEGLYGMLVTGLLGCMVGVLPKTHMPYPIAIPMKYMGHRPFQGACSPKARRILERRSRLL